MQTINLNGGWSVRPDSLKCIGESGLELVRQSQDDWIEAQVPGEIHLDLIRAGQMPEPTVGANMPKCRWPETKSWWYRTQFEVESDFLRHEHQHLVFDGLDLYAQVFVNNKLVGESKNAVVPAYFDVKQFLKSGWNELVVRMTAGNELAMELEWSNSFKGAVLGDIDFPQEWSLFGSVTRNDPEPAVECLNKVPAELEIGSRYLSGRKVYLDKNNLLDLGALLDGAETGKTAYLVTKLTVEEDMEVTIGAGMNWWQKWWVNGQVVCDTTNTGNEDSRNSLGDHLDRCCFNVRLRKGSNLLVMKAVSGRKGFVCLAGGPKELRRWRGGEDIPNPMCEDDPYQHRMWAARKWLRKSQSCYGWDWVEALPNIGIWRGVKLEGRTHAILNDLRLDTLRDSDKVSLEMEAMIENLHPWSERACVFDLEIQPPDGGCVIRRRYTLDMPPGRMPVRDMIEIPDAQLWWPNGMGDQPLYRIVGRVSDAAGTIYDTCQFSIGLRTIEIDRSRLSEGSRFCLRVNGQDVFCRGGNVYPFDAILARVSDAKSEAVVAEAKNANMNMLRFGCTVFESPAFYDACDRMGIMIWHDFMFTCTSYPDENAAFCEAVRVETETAIRLIRSHPSIALWCGNGETTSSYPSWNEDKTAMLKVGGAKIFNQILPELCRQLDPRRPYWPGSPCGGDDPNSELEGDCHWWTFFMNADMNRRIRHEVFDECRSRFVSEYGVIGPCHLDSIKDYLSPDEMHSKSLAWLMHTNTWEKVTVDAAIRLHYADPERLNVPDYVTYGQLFQAIIHGHAMEALRFRKQDPIDDCQGALIWSYSDCWGETGWSILDYYLRRKASYYWFQRACRPVKVIVRQRDNRFVTRIVNDTMQPVGATIEVGWWRLDGGSREVESFLVEVAANRMLEVTSTPVLSAKERNLNEWLYAAVIKQGNGVAVDQSVLQLRPHRELRISKPDIKVTPLNHGMLEIVSPVFCHAVHVEDHGRELLSDNWFDLLPGVPVQTHLAEGYSLGQVRLDAVL